MKYANSIEEYIAGHPGRSEELSLLRRLLLNTELEETIKWGMPTYVMNKRNIVGIAAFRNWSVLWFHDGALLSDKYGKLVNAQKGKTKGMRQWRFKQIDEIDVKLIEEYINEAIQNCKEGKKVDFANIDDDAPVSFILPEMLKEKLDDNPFLLSNWNKYTDKQRRDFSVYVSEPKREATKKSRLEKVIPLIKDCKPLAALWRKF